MGLSTLALSISESPTLKLNDEARLLRERGESVIHLGIGEPKNRTPAPAVTAAAAELERGDVKYAPTEGTPALKQAIVRYTTDVYGVTVLPANVIVSSGAKQSLYNLLFALLEPGDEVVLMAPYWVSYPEMVRMCRAVPVAVPPANGTLRPELAAIERAITPRTKVVLCNSPNNPSGLVFDDAFVAGLVATCEARDVWLVMDDIYHQLLFDGRRPTSPYRYTDRDLETTRLVTVNGVSKLYGMTGFRIGWAIASRALVQVMANIQAQTTSCASPVLQAGAAAALGAPPETVETLRRTIEGNRDVMMRELASFTNVRCERPDGAFYCLPDFSAYERDSVALSRFLLEKARVVTVPGREFGMDGHLRLSFAGTQQDIVEGVRRMKWALDPHSPKTIDFGGHTHTRDWN